MNNVYIVSVCQKNARRIVARTVEEAKIIYLSKVSAEEEAVDEEAVKVRFVRKDDSPFIKKYASGVAESAYLDTGVTRGIV